MRKYKRGVPPVIRVGIEKKYVTKRKKGRPSLGYECRRQVLHRLGFKSYRQYLLSPLWSKIRAEVMERDDYRCRTCGRQANVVHHLSYGDVTLSGQRLDKLVSLCNRCHRKVEFDHKTGKKRSLKKARENTLKRMERFDEVC